MEKQLLFEIRGKKYESDYCDEKILWMNPNTLMKLSNTEFKNSELTWKELLEKEWFDDGWRQDDILIGIRKIKKLWTHLPD